MGADTLLPRIFTIGRYQGLGTRGCRGYTGGLSRCGDKLRFWLCCFVSTTKLAFFCPGSVRSDVNCRPFVAFYTKAL